MKAYKNCKICGKIVTRRGRRGPVADYCSRRARDLANHPRRIPLERICEFCGAIFWTRNIGRRFCSRSCGAKARRARAKERAEFGPTLEEINFEAPTFETDGTGQEVKLADSIRGCEASAV